MPRWWTNQKFQRMAANNLWASRWTKIQTSPSKIFRRMHPNLKTRSIWTRRILRLSKSDLTFNRNCSNSTNNFCPRNAPSPVRECKLKKCWSKTRMRIRTRRDNSRISPKTMLKRLNFWKIKRECWSCQEISQELRMASMITRFQNRSSLKETCVRTKRSCQWWSAQRIVSLTPEQKLVISTKNHHQIIFSKRWYHRKAPPSNNIVFPSQLRWHASNQFNNQLKLKLQVIRRKKMKSKRSLMRQRQRQLSLKIITKIMSINSNQLRRRAYRNKRDNQSQLQNRSLVISSIQTSHNRKVHQSMIRTLVISQVPIPTSQHLMMRKKMRSQKKSLRKRIRKMKSQRKAKNQRRNRQKRETSQRKVRKRMKRRMKRNQMRHQRTRN